jgi:hypothetical protein
MESTMSHNAQQFAPAPRSVARRFLVTSSGLTASRWLSFALAQHPEVFVAHGRHPLDSVVRGSFDRELALSDVESFTQGNKMSEFYDDAPLEQVFDAFAALMPAAAVQGNVHAYTISSLLKKARAGALEELEPLEVLNVVRHPVSFIASHARLVRKAEAHPAVYAHYDGALFTEAQAAFPELELFDHVPRSELLAFAVSCFSIHNWRDDFKVRGVSSFRMEQLTSDVALLRAFCERLTGLRYDEAVLARQIALGPINKHRGEAARVYSPGAIFEAWEPWQQDLALMMTPPDVLDALEALGYDVAMLRLVGERRPAAAEVTTKATEPEQAAAETAKTATEDGAEDVVGPMFAAGNYAGVALQNEPERWETYAALGLVGRTYAALEGLARFDGEQARFYEGVARWIGGDDQGADTALAAVPTAHARNLLALIRKPVIEVLSQITWAEREGAKVAADPKFAVRNISFDGSDLPNAPYADVRTFDPQGPRPDFYLCQMAEWHTLPLNLQALDCPLIGQTADFDLHIQAIYPWLQLFDELLVTDPTEWDDARGLVQAPVSTFPKSFAINDALDPVAEGERNIDFFRSGTLLHPFHPDIVDHMADALDLPESCINVVLDGFTSKAIYSGLYARAKATFTYIRHSGAMPTRALEALASGCGVVVQEGSCLSIFCGEEEGVLTYGPGGEGLGTALTRIIEEWEGSFQQRARCGAEVVRREFARSKVSSQYLRFATFLAARPRGPRRELPLETLDQKRIVIEKGWLPGEAPVLRDLARTNLRWWGRRLGSGVGTARDYIDASRELVIAFMTNLPLSDPSIEDFAQIARLNIFDVEPALTAASLPRALALLFEGLERYPDSLVLRFNLVRCALHFGGPEIVERALTLARETLDRGVEGWQVDPLEDVFPWDFFPTFFNYRRYLVACTRTLAGQQPADTTLARLIHASLRYYLSFYGDHQDNAEQAVALDPDLPFYAFRLALILAGTASGPANLKRAANLLSGQGPRLIFSQQAHDLLKLLRQHRRLVGEGDGKVERFTAQLERAKELPIPVFGGGGWREGVLQPAAGGSGAAGKG